MMGHFGWEYKRRDIIFLAGLITVVSPTHVEADDLTGRIGEALKLSETMGADEQTFRVLGNAIVKDAERNAARRVCWRSTSLR